MKLWIYLGSICVLFAELPALAQSQRYPTNTELQQLRQDVQYKIPQLDVTGIYSDRRTPADREARQALVEAWADSDPAIAPFLGEWIAIEESLYIYPAATRGQVCVLDIHYHDGDFYIGEVMDGSVYTTTNLVFFLERNLLSSAFVYDDQPSTYEYGNPRPLPASLEQLEQSYPEMMDAFNQAGCVTDLPETGD